MKIAVTGAKGQLGREAVDFLRRHHTVFPLSRTELDITEREAFRNTIENIRPDVVIHTAACTHVDRCEKKRETAFCANVLGAIHAAQACENTGAKLVYVSTDYVFDGLKKAPYTETDTANPLNLYGRTKWWGERWISLLTKRYFVVRTSWLFGLHEQHFVRTIIRLADEQSILSVVDDQIGSPTYAKDVVRVLSKLIHSDAYGLYHCSNEGECSRYTLARTVLDKAGYNPDRVRPISTTDRPSAARRPLYSVLENDRLKEMGFEIPDWEKALDEWFYDWKGEITR